MAGNVKATLLAVRAVGVVFGRRIWWNVTSICIGVAVILVALCVWLISISGWWWILAILVGMAISIAFVMLTVFRLVLRYVNPTQNSDQKQAVKEFAGKLEFVKELTATPKVVILFRLIRSVAAPSSERYLEDIFESRKLQPEFVKIVRSFQ